jgi:DNA mismatch repair protein MutL
MGRILALPEALQSQIAAGEVVERPASVVKELVENALDAGATIIKVDVEAGGLARITVTDNGFGMDPDDAVACLGRHATSKLRTVEDLHALHSYGFRGEAIPSIGSVSRLTITTRTPQAPEGTRVRVEGGAPPLVEPCGTAVGTRVDVRDLFFNVPARRKFQKSDRTEATAIEEMMTRLALANPGVDLELHSDTRELLRAPPAQDATAIKDRAERILGKAARGNLYPVDGTAGDIRVHGLCANPAFSRGDQKGLYIFVNGRYVRDRTIIHAVVEGYRTLLEVGRNPVVVLHVELDPTMVDVNVHPQKLEVRFADSSNVHRAVAHVLSDMLRTTPWLRGPSRPYALATPDPLAHTASDISEFHRQRTRDALARFSGAIPADARPFALQSFSTGVSSSVPAPQTLPGLGGALVFSRLKALGQVGLTYLICEAPEGMVVLDQHAAHERYNFERLRKQQQQQGAIAVQQLLVPVRIQLSTAEEEALSRHTAALTAAGFELSSLGPGDVLLRSVPVLLQGKKPERVCKELLTELSESGASSPLQDAVDAVLARVACHASVRAGDPMGVSEIRALLDGLDGVDLGAHCPHGRPVVRTLPLSTMAHWFDRP